MRVITRDCMRGMVVYAFADDCESMASDGVGVWKTLLAEDG